jgi:hypothetical protein
MYKILAYLAIFRLQELTFPEFSKFVSAQDPAKMSGFLKYLFDADILENSIKGEWLQLYDRDYVEVLLLNGTSSAYFRVVNPPLLIFYVLHRTI